jgi:anaerobic dimethyl sulfoxide reductase subunit C (anchor subunit)
MRRSEGPLVIFTLLVQMGVGLFILLALFLLIELEKIRVNPLDDFTSINFLIIDSLLVIAVLAGTFHLGRPFKSRLAMGNLQKSWLSREMLSGFSFGLIMLILSVLSCLRASLPILSILLLILGIGTGITLLYAIARIYMLRTVPTWNSIVVPLSFFSASLLLGSILFSLVVAALPASPLMVSGLPAMEKFLRWISSGALGLMFIQILLSYLMLKGFQAHIHPLNNGYRISWTKYRLLFMLRLGLGLIGIALYINFMDLFINQFPIGGPWGYLLFTSFLLVFLSETSGRVLFYACYKSEGI